LLCLLLVTPPGGFAALVGISPCRASSESEEEGKVAEAQAVARCRAAGSLRRIAAFPALMLSSHFPNGLQPPIQPHSPSPGSFHAVGKPACASGAGILLRC